MTRARFLELVLVAACPAVGIAQMGGMMHVPAGTPRVELKGKIQKVQVARGQGMPHLEVRSGGSTVRVVLGSVRYLMEQNFNPKAGEEIVVSGFKVDGVVLAVTVKLVKDGKLLRLRDDQGRPVWMRGPRGRAMQGPPADGPSGTGGFH
jgi:hypothetical protein